ncbi:Kae1-associated serine/threonine protein kinase, partial [Candidatus Woesearchaeota archaeon]|nr:Kae1-associated serine/threonine protein kinase [Candidatus Woesearchaeota archaeon]
YRLEACDFTRMYEYIRTDPRYIELKHHKRKIIFSWTQREYRNLLKAREAGVKCPTPYAFENNVLVMEFIGDEKACPQAKNCAPRNAKKFIKDVVDEMRKLHKAGIVHGDLSEYNILNKDGSPVLIDFSQETQKNNPIFGELLERDIKNIARYAKKLDAGFDEEKIKKILGKA